LPPPFCLIPSASSLLPPPVCYFPSASSTIPPPSSFLPSPSTIIPPIIPPTSLKGSPLLSLHSSLIPPFSSSLLLTPPPLIPSPRLLPPSSPPPPPFRPFFLSSPSFFLRLPAFLYNINSINIRSHCSSEVQNSHALLPFHFFPAMPMCTYCTVESLPTLRVNRFPAVDIYTFQALEPGGPILACDTNLHSTAFSSLNRLYTPGPMSYIYMYVIIDVNEYNVKLRFRPGFIYSFTTFI
jgi:hypothetical protein